MVGARAFDVFLSHNSRDKATVRELGGALERRGLKVWLDEWELVPGRPWQEALEEVIRTTKSAAVLVGEDGLGPWVKPEMRACLDQFVRRELPVIPVLLPGVPEVPDLPLFLQGFTWVDLRGGLVPEGLERLCWGIAGTKPAGRDSSINGPDRGAPMSAPNSAVAMWTKKLDFLQTQHASASNPAQKFELEQQIEEARTKIRELGG